MVDIMPPYILTHPHLPMFRLSEVCSDPSVSVRALPRLKGLFYPSSICGGIAACKTPRW